MLRVFKKVSQMRNHIRKKKNGHNIKDCILNVALDEKVWCRIRINKQNNYYYIKIIDLELFRRQGHK